MYKIQAKPEKVQTTWTRIEVAAMYNISTKTFATWLKEANYKLRSRKGITFKQREEIFALFGNPLDYIAAENEKEEEKKKKKISFFPKTFHNCS